MITLLTNPLVPDTEYNRNFFQGMLDRMGMSYFKYGRVAEAFPKRVNAIATMKLKLEEYEKTGNTEFLVDAANYLMIEFMHPDHELAHYKAIDKSSGRVWNDEINPTERPNDPAKWV